MKQLKLIFLLLGLCGVFSAIAQTSAFKQYGAEDNVSSFIYNAIQDQDGFLYVGTGEGLLKYDGVDFQIINEMNGLAGQIVSASYIDSNSRVWLGHSKAGKLSVLYPDSISILDISEHITNKVIGICEAAKGTIWVGSQDEGLLAIDNADQKRLFNREVQGNSKAWK